jgi:hypothetical protein
MVSLEWSFDTSAFIENSSGIGKTKRFLARIIGDFGGVIGHSCRTTTSRFLKPCRLTILISAVTNMKDKQPLMHTRIQRA